MKDKKRFIVKGILFILICFSPVLIQMAFPMDYFNFRCYEALSFHRLSDNQPYYANRYLEKIEEGDIGFKTEYAIKKKVIWQTDQYGYRNYPIAENSNYDIVIIGDSNLVGSGSSQEDMLTSVLSQKTGLTSYALAPGSVNLMLSQKRFRDNPPRYVIFEVIERNIYSIGRIDVNQEIIEKETRFNGYSRIIEELDHMIKMSLIRSAITSIKIKIQPRELIVNEKTRMLFLKESLDSQPKNIQDIDQAVEIIKEYDKYFESRGIEFIFLPIPDKETIYAGELPGKYNGSKNDIFLSAIIEELRNNDINVIDTLETFKKAKNNQLLYHLDDTHWNGNAVKITADLIMQEISASTKNMSQENEKLISFEWAGLPKTMNF